jgi:predicted GIY-YIG superfamily endonuclease
MYTLYWICSPNHTDYNTQGYIGVTKNFDKRMREHYSAPNPILYKAIKKYTWEVLIKQPLVVSIDEELALLAEEMLRPNDKIGWNIIRGGGKPPLPTGKQSIGNKSNSGRKFSEEHKLKISLAKRKKQNTLP